MSDAVVVGPLSTATSSSMGGQTTLTASSANGTSMVATDSVGSSLKLRTLTSDQSIAISVDAAGGEVNLVALLPRHLEPISILSTGPWGTTESRMSLAHTELSPTGWSVELLPLSVPSLFWHGTLIDPAAGIFLNAPGYFNAVMYGLRIYSPFSTYATVVCTVPFRLSFVFNQMAGGLIKKWNATLTRATGTPDNTMERIALTTTPVVPDGVDFSPEAVPRPMLDANTTSPEGLFVTVTQDVTGVYAASGTDVWILGFDFIFG